MTPTELADLIADCRARWDSLDRRFVADAARPPERGPSLLAAWREALADVPYPEARQVVAMIYRGDLDRPYDGDLPAVIRREARRLVAAQRAGSGALDRIRDGERAIAADRAALEAIRAEWGPVLDSMPEADRLELARQVLPSQWAYRRFAAAPAAPTICRDLILRHLAGDLTLHESVQTGYQYTLEAD